MFELVAFFAMAVILSFICSLSEAGLLSLRRPDIMRLQESGHWSANILASLKADVDRPLAGILTVNTLANCFGAAGVGSAAAKIWGASGMATASAILTMCILVFSEIIPKTLGASYAVRLAGVIAVAVRGMLILTYPIVLIMKQISRLISSGPQKYSREDVVLAAQIGVSDGVIHRDEAKIISKMLKLVQTPVSDAMTPRDAVSAFPQDRKVSEFKGEPRLTEHSRFPVFGAGPQDIVGVVRRDTILEKLQSGALDCSLQDIAEGVHTVRTTDTLESAADTMERHKSKMLVVVDEQDGYQGVISMSNLLHHVFGAGVADLA